MTRQDVINMRTGLIALENDGEPWTCDDKIALLSGFKDGITISELAFQFLRSENAINQQLIQLGCYDEITKKRQKGQKKLRHCACHNCADKSTPICPITRILAIPLEYVRD